MQSRIRVLMTILDILAILDIQHHPGYDSNHVKDDAEVQICTLMSASMCSIVEHCSADVQKVLLREDKEAQTRLLPHLPSHRLRACVRIGHQPGWASQRISLPLFSSSNRPPHSPVLGGALISRAYVMVSACVPASVPWSLLARFTAFIFGNLLA